MKTQVKINDSDRQLMLTALDHAIEKYYTTYKLCLRDWVQSPEIGEEHFAKERTRVRDLINLHRRLQFGTAQARADYRRYTIEYRSESPSDCQRRRKFWSFAIADRRRNNPELRAPVGQLPRPGRTSRRAFNTQLAA